MQPSHNLSLILSISHMNDVAPPPPHPPTPGLPAPPSPPTISQDTSAGGLLPFSVTLTTENTSLEHNGASLGCKEEV